MKIIAEAQIVNWFGLYRKLTESSRILEDIYDSMLGTYNARDAILKNNKYLKEDDFMIEVVEVKMQEWKSE